MTDTTRSDLRRWGHATLRLLALLLVCGTAMLWAWNSIAVDLLQAPPIQFRHVLALQLAILASALLMRESGRIVRGANRGRLPAPAEPQ